MTARKVKISTMRKQWAFIENQLNRIPCKENGDAGFRFEGSVYPEVVKYFQAQEWTVTKVDNCPQFKPVFYFDSSDVELTSAELEDAKNFDYSSDDDEGRPDLLEPLLGFM